MSANLHIRYTQAIVLVPDAIKLPQIRSLFFELRKSRPNVLCRTSNG